MPELESVEQMNLFIDEFSEYEQEEYLPGSYAMNNDFLRMPKTLNVQSLKLLGLILSKMDFTKDNRINGKVEIECSLNEIIKACDSVSHNYIYYREVAKNLIRNTYIEGVVNGEDVMGFAIPVAKGIDNTTFVFRVSDEFLPYFQLLSSNFTIIHLQNAKGFKSRFSYNLYMNLLSWRVLDKECFRLYNTRMLKQLFGLSDDDYVRSSGKFDRASFEKKTIITAVDEINQKTNMRVQWKKNYNGKKVANYQFNFIEYSKL